MEEPGARSARGQTLAGCVLPGGASARTLGRRARRGAMSLERRHNLPAHPVRLIGRDEEMAAVRERLLEAERGLLTLTGAGGCGKTSLGLRVARDLLGEFPDGVWLVELAPLADPTLMPQAVASVLGVREGAERT